MIVKTVLNSIRAAIAFAVAKMVGEAVEAGVAKGLQTGFTRSLGEGLKLPDHLDEQLQTTIDKVPQLLTAEEQAERALAVEDPKPASKRALKRKPA